MSTEAVAPGERFSTPSSPSRQIIYALLVALLTTLAAGYQFPYANHVEDMPVLYHIIDPDLFAGDFYVKEMLKPGPRTYYQLFVTALSTSTKALPWVLYSLWMISLGAQGVALARICKDITGQSWPAALILVWMVLDRNQTGIWSFLFWVTPSTVPQTLATPLVLWCIAFAIRRQWLAGFACLAIAFLFQILIGLYCLVIVGPIWLYQVYQSRNYRSLALGLLPIAGAVAAALPIVRGASYDTVKLTSEQFMDLFVRFRFPHHNLPSFFITGTNLRNGLGFYAAAALAYALVPMLRRWRLAAWWSIMVVLACLAFAYLFISKVPVVAVAKIWPTRISMYGQLVGLVGIAALVIHSWRQGFYVCALGFCIAIFGVYAGPLQFMLALMVLIGPRFVANKWVINGAAAALLLGTIAAFKSNSQVLGALAFLTRPTLDAVFYALLAGGLYVGLRSLQPGSRPLGTGLALVVIAWAVLLTSEPTTATILGRIGYARFSDVEANYLVSPPDEFATRLETLGHRFYKQSAPGTIVITPPGVVGSGFKLYSRRANIGTFKNAPYNDEGLAIWASRMQLWTTAKLGSELQGHAASEVLDAGYAATSWNRFQELGKAFGASYILLPRKATAAAEATGQIVLEDQDHVIYRLN